MNLVNPVKKIEAEAIVRSCIGPKGIWASPARYRHQCWTRDFAIATLRTLGDMGRVDVAKRHLEELASRQLPDGRIPILFLDDVPRFLFGKAKNSMRDFRLSFMLKQYFRPHGIARLTPWTKDSEILYILSVLELMNRTRDYSIVETHNDYVGQALVYIETSLVKENGLVHGGDWRDTRLDLDDKFLLTNNCFLYRMYEFLNLPHKASAVQEAIKRNLWTGSYFRDYVGVENFDTLGNALAILYGLATEDNAAFIFKKAESLDTLYGYMLNDVTLPPKSAAEELIMNRTKQVRVIWPFIHGFMILAAVKSGFRDLAREQFAKYNAMPGFFEWYDPDTGLGYGSSDQLWSACLYLRCVHAIEQIS